MQSIKKLLITDSFFISDKNIRDLEAAGYEVTRLDKPAATEAELIEALRDVSVYIIGGIEQVTDAVIASTDKLEAIIFTGVDYTKFIPGADTAAKKRVELLNAPGANAVAVAEFAVGVALSMQRQLFNISRAGSGKYVTTRSIEDSVIGLVGAGNIGQKILEAVKVFNPKEALYYNRSEKSIGARRAELEELVKVSDVIFLTLPMNAGTVFDSGVISKIKQGALLVSISPYNLIDYDALLPRLQDGTLRAAMDWPSPSPEFDKLPMDTWFSVNSHSAYNTGPSIRNVSDSVTQTAISLLKG